MLDYNFQLISCFHLEFANRCWKKRDTSDVVFYVNLEFVHLNLFFWVLRNKEEVDSLWWRENPKVKEVFDIKSMSLPPLLHQPTLVQLPLGPCQRTAVMAVIINPGLNRSGMNIIGLIYTIDKDFTSDALPDCIYPCFGRHNGAWLGQPRGSIFYIKHCEYNCIT